MIFDNTSKQYSEMVKYMGIVSFKQFRQTGYCEMIIKKQPDKEGFFAKFGLPVKTPTEIVSNWQKPGTAKFMAGRWFINNICLFNVQHEFRHQNYFYSEISTLN